jgi:benzoylformate decarboxylase
MRVSGAEAFLHMLAAAGVRYLFGNPGTTELPLMDALAAQQQIQYVLGLQEVPVMAMADGYAQASRSLAVVNLHISCGLGNAMGMLYNAHRSGTPLLVTAGQQDRRLVFEEPVLCSDLVRVARPWTKWAVEVSRVEDLPSALRRAMQTALTPPTGPVFMALPLDLQLEAAELDLSLGNRPDVHVRPPREALEQAAELLAAAKSPAILVGSRVTEADAIAELVAVAELLGAPAISECGTSHGRLGFPCDHPLSAPGLPLWQPEVHERLMQHDVLLVVGMDLLRQYLYHEPRAIPEHVKLVHLDVDPWQLGKNFPIDVPLLGHIKPGLGELAELLRTAMTPEQRTAGRGRSKAFAEKDRQDRDALRARIAAEQDVRPMTPLTLMSALARVLPADAAVVEEAVTTTGTVLERLGAIKDPEGYFAHRGWALGWGLGCAIGVRLARPERPVLCILGEGAALYGIQGLWTAARYRIPVTFVISNNAQYQILKICARQLQLPQAGAGQFLGQDLVDPEIDFVALAQSLGVAAERIEEPDALSDTVAASLAGDAPRLIDVPLQRGGKPRL